MVDSPEEKALAKNALDRESSERIFEHVDLEKANKKSLAARKRKLLLEASRDDKNE